MLKDLDKWAATNRYTELDYSTLNEDINSFKSRLEEDIKEVIAETDQKYQSDLKEVNGSIASIQEMLSKRRYALTHSC